jgi:AraC-like DNA-binding protein
MPLNFWSILLIASASQCLFLAVNLFMHVPLNRKATIFLMLLLVIVLLTNISNLWTATYLYRYNPIPSLFTRGMVLLLGPVIYFYTRFSLETSAGLQKKDWLHFLPYIVFFAMNVVRLYPFSLPEMIAGCDEFMAGNSVVNTTSFIQFLAYPVHLIIYLALSYKKIKKSLGHSADQYIISFAQRSAWLKRIGILVLVIAVLFAGIDVSVLYTKTYTIAGNIIYTTLLTVLVYVIATQAIKDYRLLAPDFGKKYNASKLGLPAKEKIIGTIVSLMEKEKIFMDRDLTLSVLAQKIPANSHIVSQAINEVLNQSYTDLVNQYRIAEFEKRIADPDSKKYSITGIATEIGYNSKSAFNTAFKKIHNETPREYIKRLYP